MAGRRIRTIESADGNVRLFIVARDDGLYCVEAEERVSYDGFEPFWRPSGGSGLYATADDAEALALRSFEDRVSN